MGRGGVKSKLQSLLFPPAPLSSLSPEGATPVLETARGHADWLPSPPCPPIDAEVLQALSHMAGDDAPSVLAEVISSYLEDAPLRLQAITLAVVHADAAAVQKSAHAFRSLSVTVGAIPVAQLCEALETMGRAGTTVGAEVLVKQLEAEYERLEAVLQLEHPGR